MNHEQPREAAQTESEPSGQAAVEPPTANAEQQEREPTITPRIWVGSLTDYNNSVLHGAWLDAAREPEEIETDIQAMLASSPWAAQTGEVAEEWAIFDSDGFGDCLIGEHETLRWICPVAKGIAQHGLAFAAWANIMEEPEMLPCFESAYHGHYDNLHAYVEQLINDLGYDQILDRALPASIRPYVKIDITATAHDLIFGGDIYTVPVPDGGVWIFTP